MALTGGFGRMVIPVMPNGQTNAPTFTPLTMDASGEKVAFVFRVPQTGTLDSFECLLGTVANAPDNGLRFSFQDLDSSGNPDGTQDQYRDVTTGFSSNAWLAPPGPLTDDGTNGGVKRSVTAGQLLSCVIEFVSFTASDDVDISVFDLPGSTDVSILPLQHYTSLFTASWAKSFNAGAIALKYDDGNYVPIAPLWYPFLAFNTATYNSGSTPDERGLRFQVPAPVTVNGFWARGDWDGDCDFVLYDSDGTTALATVAFASGQRSSTVGCNVFVTCGAVDLAASTTYRLTVKPTSGTNLSLYDFDVNSSALMAGVDGGAQWYYTQRTDAGSWTDTATKRPWMGLAISRIDDGTGSGATGEVSHTWLG